MFDPIDTTVHVLVILSSAVLVAFVAGGLTLLFYQLWAYEGAYETPREDRLRRMKAIRETPVVRTPLPQKVYKIGQPRHDVSE